MEDSMRLWSEVQFEVTLLEQTSRILRFRVTCSLLLALIARLN